MKKKVILEPLEPEPFQESATSHTLQKAWRVSSESINYDLAVIWGYLRYKQELPERLVKLVMADIEHAYMLLAEIEVLLMQASRDTN